ncbi:hypothetical protein BJ546DRAFT_1067069 [Cryomyces antarcticus]
MSLLVVNPVVSLSSLPDELILHILHHLDIPELLAASRTSHRLRALTTDPLLHAHRRRRAANTLSILLAHRPPLRTLRPPASSIYLSGTHVAARSLFRNLVASRLNRQLARRPSRAELVTRNVLPAECARGVAGSICTARRRVEREMLMVGLRAWVGRKAEGIRRRGEKERVGVRGLAWRFARLGSGVVGIGGERRGADGEVGTARVGGLRLFWEGVAAGRACKG